MSNKETMEEIRERLRREKEAARQNSGNKTEVVSRLAHEDHGPDFAKIAEDLKRRHEEEKHSLNEGYVKMTIYVEENIAAAFNALCIKRGDQKKYLNEALADYVAKKHRELNS